MYTCHSFPLQRPLHGDPNFFKISSKIKGKCLLNAGFLKRKLWRIPLIKIGKNGPRTMLKGRAFEGNLGLSFRETLPLRIGLSRK